MRIVGGRFRGLKLAGFDAKGIRPTTDRVREALFNILAHDSALRTDAGPFPAGVQVLDVFAGTGAMGLEALSRGAAHVTFLENDTAALALLQENVKKSRAEDQVRIARADALRPQRASSAVELVLMDPPYGHALAEQTIASLEGTGWISSGTFVVVETDARDAFESPAGFESVDQRKYGRTALRFLRKT
jgi:16S rRNA (guanine966-N2)-methyltransferase